GLDGGAGSGDLLESGPAFLSVALRKGLGEAGGLFRARLAGDDGTEEEAGDQSREDAGTGKERGSQTRVHSRVPWTQVTQVARRGAKCHGSKSAPQPAGKRSCRAAPAAANLSRRSE